MNTNVNKFIYDETIRRSRTLENNVFVLYLPKINKLQLGEIKSIKMKIKFKMSKNLVGACTLLPSLSQNNIKLLNSFHIAMDGVTASLNQSINLLYIFAVEIQNQNMNGTFQLRKKQELGFFTLLNKGAEEIRHKFIKTKDHAMI